MQIVATSFSRRSQMEMDGTYKRSFHFVIDWDFRWTSLWTWTRPGVIMWSFSPFWCFSRASRPLKNASYSSLEAQSRQRVSIHVYCDSLIIYAPSRIAWHLLPSVERVFALKTMNLLICFVFCCSVTQSWLLYADSRSKTQEESTSSLPVILQCVRTPYTMFKSSTTPLPMFQSPQLV